VSPLIGDTRSMVNENRAFPEKGCCGICNGRDHSLQLKFSDRRILRCRSCGIIFSDLIWDRHRIRQLYETPDFFGGDYWQWNGYSALDVLDFPAYDSALLAAKVLLGGTGRLLDVGCGLGGFLARSLAMRFVTEGTDVSEYASRIIEQRIGIAIHLGELPSLHLADGTYDVVSSWDTLEHVLDPRAMLLEMHRLVRPGGVLILRTINEDTVLTATANALYRIGIASAAARMHEPYHLYYWTRPLLSRLLTECGFTPRVRFDCEIHCGRLGLNKAGRFAMTVMYRTQALLNREFMQLLVASAG